MGGMITAMAGLTGLPDWSASLPHCTQGYVYLLHFEKPFGHARHYVGWAKDLEARLSHHGTRDGANLMWHVHQAGISWELARVWEGGKTLERRFHNDGGKARKCPVCKLEAKAAL